MNEGSSADADQKFGVFGQCSIKAWPLFLRECSSLGEAAEGKGLTKPQYFSHPYTSGKKYILFFVFAPNSALLLWLCLCFGTKGVE